jgi:hypothetical protein
MITDQHKRSDYCKVNAKHALLIGEYFTKQMQSRKTTTTNCNNCEHTIEFYIR